MKLRKATLLTFAVSFITALAACSSAGPTATVPAGTPTPIAGAGLFTPHVQRSSATDTDGVGRSWGRMARWDARLGWSIELPERGEWEFVRTLTPTGNELIEARRMDGEDMPFQVVRLELGAGSEELVVEGYNCGGALRSALNTGGVASSEPLPETQLGGVPAKLSKITMIEPAGSEGRIFAVCMVTADYLYMASGHAPETDDEEDVLTMMRSFRVQG